MGPETVGDRITALRSAQRVKGRPRTQTDLADAAGLDRAYLGRIERGEIAEPGIDVLERIAYKGLRVPVVAIAPPGYYTTAQFLAARAELLAMPQDAATRSVIDWIEDQIEARRQAV